MRLATWVYLIKITFVDSTAKPNCLNLQQPSFLSYLRQNFEIPFGVDKIMLFFVWDSDLSIVDDQNFEETQNTKADL